MDVTPLAFGHEAIVPVSTFRNSITSEHLLLPPYVSIYPSYRHDINKRWAASERSQSAKRRRGSRYRCAANGELQCSFRTPNEKWPREGVPETFPVGLLTNVALGLCTPAAKAMWKLFPKNMHGRRFMLFPGLKTALLRQLMPT